MHRVAIAQGARHGAHRQDEGAVGAAVVEVGRLEHVEGARALGHREALQALHADVELLEALAARRLERAVVLVVEAPRDGVVGRRDLLCRLQLDELAWFGLGSGLGLGFGFGLGLGFGFGFWFWFGFGFRFGLRLRSRLRIGLGCDFGLELGLGLGQG